MVILVRGDVAAEEIEAVDDKELDDNEAFNLLLPALLGILVVIDVKTKLPGDLSFKPGRLFSGFTVLGRKTSDEAAALPAVAAVVAVVVSTFLRFKGEASATSMAPSTTANAGGFLIESCAGSVGRFAELSAFVVSMAGRNTEDEDSSSSA